jgi:hypothetical protein
VSRAKNVLSNAEAQNFLFILNSCHKQDLMIARLHTDNRSCLQLAISFHASNELLSYPFEQDIEKNSIHKNTFGNWDILSFIDIRLSSIRLSKKKLEKMLTSLQVLFFSVHLLLVTPHTQCEWMKRTSYPWRITCDDKKKSFVSFSLSVIINYH